MHHLGWFSFRLYSYAKFQNLNKVDLTFCDNQGCQRVQVTDDIPSYDLPVERENVGEELMV